MNLQEQYRENCRELEHIENQLQDMMDAMRIMQSNCATMRGVNSEVVNLKRDLPVAKKD